MYLQSIICLILAVYVATHEGHRGILRELEYQTG